MNRKGPIDEYSDRDDEMHEENKDEQPHPFSGLSLMGQEYLEETKKLLTPEQALILYAEETIKDEPADSPYTSWKGGWKFATIKDSKLQSFLPHLHTILELFYKRVTLFIEQEQGGEISDMQKEMIDKRKVLVSQSILEKIQDHNMYKLQKTYYDSDTNKYVTYDCSPLVEVELTRGKNTYISHIFKPSLDINIIEGVGGSFGGGHETFNIRISKDVFEGANHNSDKEDNYLAHILGYSTKEKLLDALKNGDINSDSKNYTFLGHTPGVKTDMN